MDLVFTPGVRHQALMTVSRVIDFIFIDAA